MLELQAVLEGRQTVYRMLGSLFRTEVTPQTLEALRARPFPADENDETLASAAIELNAAAAALTPADLDELAADYARTFLSAGVADGRAAFPFESVYTSPEKLVMQDAYEAVHRLLCAEGVAPEEPDLYDDHLGIELAFMAHLAGKTARALAQMRSEDAEKGLDEEKAFLAAHLLNWTGKFFKDLDEVAASRFYRALGRYTSAWLEADRRWLEA